MAKLKIALVAGGPSSEHEISIASSKNILKYLDVKKFDVTLALISPSNKWGFGKNFEDTKPTLGLDEGIKQLIAMKPGLVFNGLHGAFGEDGTLQKILEDANIRFTGSGSKASASAMNKIVSQSVVRSHGLKTIDTLDFEDKDWAQNSEEIMKSALKLGLPLVVKPADGGSSIGVFLNQEESDLRTNIESALKFSKHIAVQPFIKGQEFTCGVIEIDGIVRALEITEMVVDGDKLFDFDSKYKTSDTTRVTPANIPQALEDKIKSQAVAVHTAHGCKQYSRTDFLVKDGEVYFLELNTLPGMTNTSLFPRQAEAVGIEFPELLELIIEGSLR